MSMARRSRSNIAGLRGTTINSENWPKKLAALNPTIIVAGGGAPSARAAKSVTAHPYSNHIRCKRQLCERRGCY